MMYIITRMRLHPKMIEPTTVSIGLYLLARTPVCMDKNNKIIKRKPILFKKKICKWIFKNHDTIIDTLIDETNDYLLDSLNIINFNPSIFLILYIVALMLIIIF
jgi:hypothetical protein